VKKRLQTGCLASSSLAKSGNKAGPWHESCRCLLQPNLQCFYKPWSLPACALAPSYASAPVAPVARELRRSLARRPCVRQLAPQRVATPPATSLVRYGFYSARKQSGYACAYLAPTPFSHDAINGWKNQKNTHVLVRAALGGDTRANTHMSGVP
jgi:hypothetical protein